MRLLISAVLYFVIVFGAGFVLGPIRVFWLEPLLGTTGAVLCEMPFLLLVMALAARWVPARVGLDTGLASLAAMGIGALALQQVADFSVGIYLRGIGPAEQAAYFATPAGGIYGLSLLLFAAMPMLVNRVR